MKLLVSTRNMHKLDEIRYLLDIPGLELLSVDDFEDLPEVVEDGDTFEANAIKKAAELAAITGLWTLADDSGIEVDALGGEPGIYSARYAGVEGDAADPANNEKLLGKMDGVEDRTARFRCAIALVSPDGEARTVSGACEGVVLQELIGDGGFGYDPMFLPDGFDRTFAQLTAEEKHSVSHRSRALAKAREEWAELFKELAG